jgi:hypothetical protein
MSYQSFICDKAVIKRCKFVNFDLCDCNLCPSFICPSTVPNATQPATIAIEFCQRNVDECRKIAANKTLQNGVWLQNTIHHLAQLNYCHILTLWILP